MIAVGVYRRLAAGRGDIGRAGRVRGRGDSDARLPGCARLAVRRSRWFSLAMLALGLNFLGHHDTEYGHIPLAGGAGVGLGVGLSGMCRDRRSVRVASRVPFGGLGMDACRRFAAMATFWPRRGSSRWPRCWRRRCRRIMPASRHPLVRGLDQSLPVRGRSGRRYRAAGPVVPRSHARRPPASSDRPVPRRSGSGRGAAWPSTARPAPTTPTAWPTGSRDFRTTSISTARRPSLCVRTSTIGTDLKPATRRRPTPIGPRWPCARERPTSSPRPPSDGKQHSRPRHQGPLELLHVEGRYAVYRVNPELLVQRQR